MNEYEQQAVNFLNKAKATMTIKHVGVVQGFPFDSKDKWEHNHYEVTLKRYGKEYKFPFYGSYNDWKYKITPNEYDILASLEKYSPGDMADFVGEYGYEIKDTKSFLNVERIWKSCEDQYRHLLDMFGEELMEEMREIW